MSEPSLQCPLCHETGGVLIVQNPEWRLIRAEDRAFPAFYRLVWQSHVAEFSDLTLVQRQRCMELVCGVEQVLRDSLRPTKINLASLGNVVPHLHWHIIARFDWDSHFPQPVWGVAQREPEGEPADRLGVPLQVLDQRMREVMQGLAEAST